MLSLLAIGCWIGGLVLLTVNPWLGSALAAAGFVAAGAALRRPDDMALMFGLVFMAIIGISVLRVAIWVWQSLLG